MDLPNVPCTDWLHLPPELEPANENVEKMLRCKVSKFNAEQPLYNIMQSPAIQFSPPLAPDQTKYFYVKSSARYTTEAVSAFKLGTGRNKTLPLLALCFV